MGIKKAIPSLKRHDHALVGRHVWYQSKIWLVVSAHATPSSETAWLTLKRDLVEAVAKSYEVKELYN